MVVSGSGLSSCYRKVAGWEPSGLVFGEAKDACSFHKSRNDGMRDAGSITINALVPLVCSRWLISPYNVLLAVKC